MSAKREVMLSARIAEHVARAKFEALPAKTVLAAKRAILDGLGVMLAASGMSRDVLPFVDLARAQGGPAEASILGFGDRVGLPMAAFANGSMAHALDYEDAFDAVPVHRFCQPHSRAQRPALRSAAAISSPRSQPAAIWFAAWRLRCVNPWKSAGGIRRRFSVDMAPWPPLPVCAS
jgi:hypothetical protein